MAVSRSAHRSRRPVPESPTVEIDLPKDVTTPTGLQAAHFFNRVPHGWLGSVTLSNSDAKIDHIGPPGRAQLQRIKLAP